MRIKRVSSWALPILILSLLAYIFGYSNILTVKDIQVNQVAENSEIQRVLTNESFNIRIGAKLARVNVKGAQKSISEIGWVQSASVSRNWISGRIKISAISRKAVARILISGVATNTYIDSNGIIYENSNEADKPPAITIADTKLAKLAAEFIIRIPEPILGSMKSLTLSQAGDFNMLEKFGSKELQIRWGNSSELDTKLKIYEKLIGLPENKSITAIDLSVPKYPIVKNN